MARPFILLVALLLTGCPPPQPKETAWELVLAQVQKDGTVSVGTARAAFSLALRPLPGVSRPPGKDALIGDATLAIRWVDAHAGELTTAQLAAVAAPCEEPATTDAMMQAHYEGLVDQASMTIAAALGVTPLPVATVVNGAESFPGGKAAVGYTCAFNSAGERQTGLFASCTIHINPSAFMAPDEVVTETVPHEVFHCYEASLIKDLGDYARMPSWLAEGAGEWVQATLTGHAVTPADSTGPGGAWRRCLEHPENSLYTTTYDSICFYSEMDKKGIPPWSRFGAMFLDWVSGGNDGAFLSGVGDETFFDPWSRSYVRQPALGPDWDITGPAISAERFAVPQVTIGNGDSTSAILPPVSNDAARLDLSAQVVIFVTPDYARLQSPGSGLDPGPPQGAWCVGAAMCDCPMDSPHVGEHLPSLPADQYYLAVNGGMSGFQWTVLGQTLDTYCQSTGVDPCLQGGLVEETAEGRFGCSYLEPLGPVLSIRNNGSVVEDYSGFSDWVMCAGPQAAALAGASTAKIIAQHGMFQVSNIDTSGMILEGVADSVGLQTFVLLGNDPGTGVIRGTYACSSSTAGLHLPDGTSFYYSR